MYTNFGHRFLAYVNSTFFGWFIILVMWLNWLYICDITWVVLSSTCPFLTKHKNLVSKDSSWHTQKKLRYQRFLPNFLVLKSCSIWQRWSVWCCVPIFTIAIPWTMSHLAQNPSTLTHGHPHANMVIDSVFAVLLKLASNE